MSDRQRPPRLRLTRRTFLTTAASVGALGAAGCGPGAAGAPVAGLPPVPPPGAEVGAPPAPALAPPAAVPPAPPIAAPTNGITAHTIAEAEKLAAVDFTAPERDLLVKTIEEQVVAVARGLRSVSLPNSLAPAALFIPGAPLPSSSSSSPARGRAKLHPSRSPIEALPKRDEDIAFSSVTQLSAWIRARKLSSTRLTEIYLERLERLGPRLECVITLTRELALAQAKAADAEIARGRWRGPLHGLPYGAKDLLDTAGIRTTWGAKPFAERVPTVDAAVIRRLADAGAVLVAKLSLGELAMGDVWFGGRTRNPWNLDEGSSGSSAGSAAAVSAGLVAFALGSETLGSIVAPSMRCGVTGLRPTFGRVARTGAMALSWSMDKLGPIARSVEDTLLVLDAIHGADAGDPSSVTAPLAYDAARPLRGLKVGYDPAWFTATASTDAGGANDVDRAALDAARELGVTLVEIDVPKLPYDSLPIILFAEAGAAFDELTRAGLDDELVQQTQNAWPNTFRAARFASAVDLVNAQRVRRQVMEAFAGVFARADVLLGPSFAGPMLLATNMTGHPSLTLPAGFVLQTSRGFGVVDPPAPSPDAPKTMVPHGVTLWGRLFDEGTLCRVGLALEASLGVWNRRPPLA